MKDMQIIKRIFDLVFAVTLGVVLMPVVICIVASIKLTSPGPVLFRQKRLGLNGEIFLMNKFRKFPSDWGSKGPGVTLQFDARMTKVGRVLERTKLDELPQLWNILIGEMSFVGPRPESVSFQHLFDGEFNQVLEYKPGIFGPNQTAYRNESAMYPEGEDPVTFYERELFPAKARADIEYFKNASFMGDIKWIFTGTAALLFNAIIWRKSMRPSVALLAWDIGTVLLAWSTMHWVKFSVWRPGVMTTGAVNLFKMGFLIIPLVLIVIFTLTRVYRHPVRYFSSTDAYRLLGNCCAVWMLSAIALRLAANSASSMLLAASCIFSMGLMCLPRVTYQQMFSRFDSRKRINHVKGRIRVAVCGIDARSISLCNLLTDGFERANLIGIVSDDLGHVRREIHGIEVIGVWSDLDILIARYQFEQLWVGTTLQPRIERDVLSWCAENNVDLIMLSGLKGFSSLTKNKIGQKQMSPSESDRNPAEVAV